MEPINEQFSKSVKLLQRPINCLTDEDRNTRKAGLTTISTQIDNLQQLTLIKLFTQTHLQQYIVKRTLWDKIQNNRELTLKIITKFCNKFVLLNTNSSPILLKPDHVKPFIEQLIKRINNTPFPQTSEDLRLDIIKLLQKMVKLFPQAFSWFIGDIASALARTLGDPYAEIKHASNSLINTLCERFKDSIGQHSLNIIKSLALNLNHQHSKVRKGTLHTVGQLLITHNAASHFEHIQLMLKVSLSDKSTEVRREAVVCVGRLLKGLGPKYMKMYEATLVGYLLAALSDENVDNTVQVIRQLQECGAAIRQMIGVNQQKMQQQTN